MTGSSRPPALVVARDPVVEAAERLAVLLGAALAARGRATVAVSGGSTPTTMFDALRDHDVDWDHVDVFQVDERVAPDGHPDRNAVALVAHFPPGARLHLMDVTSPDLDAAAARYATELASVTGDGILDVVHLGLGDDGHTASWPPDGEVQAVVDRDVAVTGVFNGRRRMTLTVPAVNRARHRLVLVAGAAKAAAVAAMLRGDAAVPASLVTGDETTVVADAAAAAGPPHSAG